jgi:flavorubredoxin
LILDKYEKWSHNIPEVQSVLIIYGTMYNNTELVVDTLATKLALNGVRKMRIYDVSEFDVSYLIADVWKYSHIVIATPTYNTGIFHLIYNLLHELITLNLSNRKFSFIVNQTWGGTALKQLNELIGQMKNIEIVGEPLEIQSTVKNNNIEAIDKLAKDIANSVKGIS